MTGSPCPRRRPFRECRAGERDETRDPDAAAGCKLSPMAAIELQVGGNSNAIQRVWPCCPEGPDLRGHFGSWRLTISDGWQTPPRQPACSYSTPPQARFSRRWRTATRSGRFPDGHRFCTPPAGHRPRSLIHATAVSSIETMPPGRPLPNRRPLTATAPCRIDDHAHLPRRGPRRTAAGQRGPRRRAPTTAARRRHLPSMHARPRAGRWPAG